MLVVFYISAAIAVLSSLLAITRSNAVHALLYLVVSLLAVAMVFFAFSAPFAAALEVIIYAGAIVVMLVFVVMMLNQGPASIAQEKSWQQSGLWIGPSLLGMILFAELIYVIASVHIGAGDGGGMGGVAGGLGRVIEPKEVAVALFGAYAIGVELASLLLLAGLVAAYHLGRRDAAEKKEPVEDQGGRR
ncbi:MAG: NADH-quinone oxidoreductase subunit J [Candidatus Sumerlaeota bacterium]|nr:NADH-quinone oxidoreductase subunit J [Candidatus Sumerlaeota bacterium]